MFYGFLVYHFPSSYNYTCISTVFCSNRVTDTITTSNPIGRQNGAKNLLRGSIIMGCHNAPYSATCHVIQSRMIKKNLGLRKIDFYPLLKKKMGRNQLHGYSTTRSTCCITNLYMHPFLSQTSFQDPLLKKKNTPLAELNGVMS